MIIKGNGDIWEVIPQEETTSSFWGLEHFQGKIYVADNSSLYTIDDQEVSKVNMGLAGNITTSYLFSNNDKILWSVGERNICIYDGTKWINLTT